MIRRQAHPDCLLKWEAQLLERLQVRNGLRVDDSELLGSMERVLGVYEENHHTFLVRFKNVLLRLLVVIIVVWHVRILLQTQLSLLSERVELDLVEHLVRLLFVIIDSPLVN